MPSYEALRRGSPVRRPLAVLATTLAFVVGGEILLGNAFNSLREGTAGLPWWLPQLGTIGETVATYLLFVHVFEYIVVPAALLWLGYAYGYYRATADTRRK